MPSNQIPSRSNSTDDSQTVTYLSTVRRHSVELTTALDELRKHLPRRSKKLGSELEKILKLYPLCLSYQAKLRDPAYKVQACRTGESCKLFMKAVRDSRAAIIHFSHISTLEHASLSIPQLAYGESTDVMLALQLKAAVLNIGEQRKTRRLYPLLKDVADQLLDDIINAAYKLNPHIPCMDIAQKCSELAQAIQEDTVWPEPYIGRELDADMLLRLSHSIVCPASDALHTVAEKASVIKFDKLRKLLEDFLERDANQTTPLIPRLRSLPIIGTPSMSVSSFTSTSTTMAPSIIAERCFYGQELSSDLEFDRQQKDRGGFGTVHQGLWMNTAVAIKVIGETEPLDKSTLRKTNREKFVWNNLYQEFILPCFGIAEFDDRDAFVSPWIDDNAKRHFMSRDFAVDFTPEEISERLKFVCQLAGAIMYLHKRKIIHGDLRLSNILVSASGDALVTDFGLSKYSDTQFEELPSTSFERSGSTRWMAPELLMDDKPCRSRASDVWAFACTVLELFSGTRPYFEHKGEAKVVMQIIADKPPTIPPLARKAVPLLWQILKGCWVRDSKARPRIQELLLALIMLRTRRSQFFHVVNNS